jgi:hypothetical protein
MFLLLKLSFLARKGWYFSAIEMHKGA